jgi:hypothetical protein
VDNTTELYIGIKVAGTDTDIADLEAFLKATKQLDFPTLLALWSRLTSVTWTEIKIVSQTIPSVSEETLYPKGGT